VNEEADPRDERPSDSYGRPGGRRAHVWPEAIGLIWLIFLGFPIANIFTHRSSPLGKGAALAGGVVFVVGYLLCFFIDDLEVSSPRMVKPILAVLILDATVLSLTDGSAWGMAFIFASSGAAHLLPRPLNAWAVALNTVLVIATLMIDRASAGTVIGYSTPTAGVGMLMLLLSDMRARNRELVEARAELARLAVAGERERFARDLHDLLGQSLSVIALKAELAGRLIETRPAEATREIAEVQDVARKALSEVRDAVSAYRQPTIDGELKGAEVALSAAGVRAELSRDPVALRPEVEGVFAWTIREGATNVLRHSGALTCAITVGAGIDGARVEVRDDGVGAVDAVPGSRSGHGLKGLAERAASVGGRLEAGPAPDGGFRLALTVPLA
jgi:two-component system sensor histidine kinase DesK